MIQLRKNLRQFERMRIYAARVLNASKMGSHFYFILIFSAADLRRTSLSAPVAGLTGISVLDDKTSLRLACTAQITFLHGAIVVIRRVLPL